MSAAPLALGERPLTAADVVAVAHGRRVALAERARERMARSRTVLEGVLARGDAVYGATTGVGAIKTVRIEPGEQADFNRLLLRSHVVGHGQPVPETWVRATMVVRAAGLALGAAGVRPAVVDALAAALDAGFAPTVHEIGSLGQADLSQLAEIGAALAGAGPEAERLAAHGLAPLVLEPREAHALVNANAFSTGVACLGLFEARAAVEALELGAALAYEAVLGNVDQLHPAVAALRPYPGHVAAAARLRALLAGGALAERRTPPRNLQDALAFKGLAQTQGAARDALDALERTLALELGASGDSPIVLVEEDRAISTGNHESAPVLLALEQARLGLAQVATIASERVQKLLTPAFTGLASGLRADPESPEDGLAIAGHGAASLAAEIRLLAAPVALEQPTSSVAEGIEDRVTMTPVAARRLVAQAALTTRLAAVELVCAAQAVDLRGRRDELGAGTWRLFDAVRAYVPFTAAGSAPAGDLDGLAGWLRDAADAAAALGVPVRDRDRPRLLALGAGDGPLEPAECADRARRAAELIDASALDRSGGGGALLLWRTPVSEAWLNLWWDPRDTGYHDHDGSAVGVHVIEGRAANEPLVVSGPRLFETYGPGDSFSFPGDGIHRMEHEPGAVTVHVYSPPIRTIGHYELVEGELRRTPGAPEDPSPPSPALLAATDQSSST